MFIDNCLLSIDEYFEMTIFNSVPVELNFWLCPCIFICWVCSFKIHLSYKIKLQINTYSRILSPVLFIRNILLFWFIA